MQKTKRTSHVDRSAAACFLSFCSAVAETLKKKFLRSVAVLAEARDRADLRFLRVSMQALWLLRPSADQLGQQYVCRKG